MTKDPEAATGAPTNSEAQEAFASSGNASEVVAAAPSEASAGSSGAAIGVAAQDSKRTRATEDGNLETMQRGMANVSLQNGDNPVAEPPSTLTIPGAPVGDVAFDHPPSKAEQKEARETLDIKV